MGMREEGAIKSTVTGVEMFKKSLNQGQAGDNVGLLLRGIKREDVLRGQVLTQDGPGRSAFVSRGRATALRQALASRSMG